MKKDFTVVFGDMAYDARTEQIECPPTTVNNRKRLPQKGRQMLEGEMAIKLEQHTCIKDNEQVTARINNTLETIMVSKEILAKESKQAVKAYMAEKAIATIAEVIEQSKIVDFEQRKTAKKESEEQVI